MCFFKVGCGWRLWHAAIVPRTPERSQRSSAPTDTKTSCGRALREKRTVVIRDIALDGGYAAHRSVIQAARCRSVTSDATPEQQQPANLRSQRA
jgi:hypothetical protein